MLIDADRGLSKRLGRNARMLGHACYENASPEPEVHEI